MGKVIDADYEQLLLLPRSVEDWVGAEHLARFVRDFVEALDLAPLGFEVGGPEQGRPPYSEQLLLKVWLYGYLRRVRTSRKLEEACGEHMGLIWLTGQKRPDHNTLWRFWHRNRGALRGLFKRVLQVAAAAELVGVVLHAVDGTKIAARASRHGVRTRKKLEEVLAELDTVVEEVMGEVEEAEREEPKGYQLAAQWQDTARRRERLRELIAGMEAEEREQGQLQEPEARLMKTNGGGTVPAYNAQLAVDEKSGMIVAQDVVREPDDTYLLAGMIEQVEANLGKPAVHSVADAGYHAPKALQTLAERGYEVVVNESAQRAPRPGTAGTEFHTARFDYDAGRDVCVCPRGEELHFERWSSARGHRAAARIYRCKSFRECPVRWQCSGDPRGRYVEIAEHHAAVVAQRKARELPENRERLRKRFAIVEGAFGLIKRVMEFRRWTVGGLENVRAQWAMVCTAFNLAKLYTLWRRAKLAAA